MRAVIMACAVVLCVPVAAADAAGRFTIRGAGFGHGVGMSQYGAYGFALEGRSYDQILRHYYSGTELGQAGGGDVRVLLEGSVSRSSFSGARRAGSRRLNPAQTYYVRQASGTVEVANEAGKVLARSNGVLVVRPSRGTVRLGGLGLYRGNLEYRESGIFGVQAVNALGVEPYVRGVVSYESPASWPAEALKAQAVAARTYALTTSKDGNGFDQYADTRSQVYGGVAAETPTTDAAVRATKGRVVTYDGVPVVTYFFSTSGGRTENVENSFSGAEPSPWLRSVKDPFDDQSPKHRWVIRMTMDEAAAKLSEYVKGTFKGIDVIERGRSPRIVTADVVGTGGRTRVSGATLRAELGLFDTWAYFSSVDSNPGPKAEVDRTALLGREPSARAATSVRRLVGSVYPYVRGSDVAVQRRGARGWTTVGTADTDASGRYEFAASSPGTYRVRYLVDVGPVVQLG